MDLVSKESIASSYPFRFLVGPDGREFTIHSALVAHQSDALNTLVNGQFKEAIDRVVRWETVDEDTFFGFWQYVYTGDYETAKPTIEPKSRREASPKPAASPFGSNPLPLPSAASFGSGPISPAPAAPILSLSTLYKYGPLPPASTPILPLSSLYGFGPMSSCSISPFGSSPTPPVSALAGASSIPSQNYPYFPMAPFSPPETPSETLADDSAQWNLFASGGRGQGQRRDQASKQPTKQESQWDQFKNLSKPDPPPQVKFKDRGNKSSDEDYTAVFLCHARIYVLAECYGIVRLMELSFRKLHQTLIAFNLYKERINDVVALLRYCHEELVPETLIEMVVLYASCNVARLWTSEQFQELVEVHGELSRALMGTMLKRLD